MLVELVVEGLAFATTSDRWRETVAPAGAAASGARGQGARRAVTRLPFAEMGTPEEAQGAMSRRLGSQLDGRSLRGEFARAGAPGGGWR
jgi:hypothetical protein